ncbi:MAG TPA: SDR family NAD(P)-dependent oxidoreductase [Burkholderiales bacterium]|nr:SDR family NAD(P)-dependent oxidoreductase [Burkholderiales bacterium]
MLAGRTALITGAGGNLGRAVAAAFGAAGAALVLLGRTEASLRPEYGSGDARTMLVGADLTDAGAVAVAVGQALARFARIDVVCNLAGGFDMGPPVHQTPDELWQRMVDLNVRTMLNTVRAAVPGMRAARYGKIVNVGAMAGLAGKAHMGAYAAAKSMVIRLTESLSAELRDDGINVNCVLPSIIDTPQNRAAMPKADPRRWVSPAALADVLLFLVSDKSAAIHGAAIPVTGLV